jgi:acetyl esterase/lipase
LAWATIWPPLAAATRRRVRAPEEERPDDTRRQARQGRHDLGRLAHDRAGEATAGLGFVGYSAAMSPSLYLIASLVGAAFTLTALIRVRRLPAGLTMGYFMASWLTGELALHHVAWQAAATVIFAMAGAFESAAGITGLAITFASWAGLLVAQHNSRQAAAVSRTLLRELEAPADDTTVPFSVLLNPFKTSREGVRRVSDIEYGEALPGDKGKRNLLDVISPTTPGEKRPVLVQIHGGAWIMGEKHNQAQPLMHHLAERGWVCFASNYRLSPQATFPDHIVDVKRAIAFAREHAAEYGGDPDFICITGGSAGGHLCALAALTANDESLQPGFETADTSVAACVPFYGVYDFLDRRGIRGSAAMEPFLEKTVLKCSPAENPELWENASPLTRIHADAPPFLVIQGTADSLVFVEEARDFVASLREKSRNPVHYAEFPGAQHAFDMFHSVRSAHAVRIVTAFLEKLHSEYGERRARA